LRVYDIYLKSGAIIPISFDGGSNQLLTFIDQYMTQISGPLEYFEFTSMDANKVFIIWDQIAAIVEVKEITES
jgi:hypothetical protein